MKRFLFITKLMIVMALTVGVILIAGCQNNYDPEAFHVFYVNEEKTRLTNLEYELQATSVEEQIQELLDELAAGTGRTGYGAAIPSDVKVLKYEITNGLLEIYFDPAYSEMSEIDEVLCRAAIVKTMVQLEEVDNVSFYIVKTPLKNASGNIVGPMNESSFIDNPGEDMQTIQVTELTLYFASADGKSLVKEVQEVHYNSNVSMEKKIIEQLLEETDSEYTQSAIPEGTQLINISVLDGICVVNFDDGFKNYNYDISEEVVIYSIVNSLTELDTIQAVQISINGETNMVYRENMSLAEQYTRNLSLVTEEVATVEVVDDATQKGGALNNRTE